MVFMHFKLDLLHPSDPKYNTHQISIINEYFQQKKDINEMNANE